MKEAVVKYLKKYPIVQLGALLKATSLRRPTGGEKNYPEIIQLPITYHCNSKCVMCNIWQMDYSNEWPVEEFARSMKDPLFSKVKAVGINGGEPTLVKNLDQYAEEILKLPSIRFLNIITHGFNKKQLFPFLEKIYAKCKERGVHFSVIVSLDGYGEVHNTVRGLKVFSLVEQSIREIQENMPKYCDEFEVACTVVKQNVDSLVELDTYARRNNIRIKYRLGIENKRIESDKLTEQYSILYHNVKQSAKEFFHLKFAETRNFYDKFKYYDIFSFLNSAIPKRNMGCDYKNKGVTVDSRGAIYYCAVASEKIGSLREKSGEEIFFDPQNLKYRESIVQNDCDECIHDYRGKAHWSSVIKFLKSYFYEKFYGLNYRLKVRFA
jgi:sulfatase maturation enzyme AslB (radical SAM superfamily)